uniref:NOP2/Sun RNA methyltransferase 6 n=2 Tax=Oncorhynchus TaxID=8016 RepID=A0A8C7J641_ONCKI
MPEEMSIFPRIALKPEVHDYLRNVFINKEVLAAVSQGEAEQRFQRLLSCLSHPPALTCVRASTHLASLEEIQHRLGEELKQVGIPNPPRTPSQQGHYWLLHCQVPEELTGLD